MQINRKLAMLLCSILVLGTFVPVDAKTKKTSGPKRRIAVIDFEDKSSHSYRWWPNVGSGMAEMLTTTLFKTGKFVVIERDQIQKVLEEQRLGASGAVIASTAAKLGRLIGVSYIVTGAVTEFGIKESKLGVGNLGRKFGLGGGGDLQTQTARVGLDLRIIDASTGQIIAAEKANATNTSRSIKLDVDSLPSLEFGKEGFDETTLGKATREAIDDSVKKIEKNLEETPWYGRIVKVNGEKILINTGEDDGCAPGHVFAVQRYKEELIDPDTGESLGVDTSQIGIIKIKEVKGRKLSEAFSIAGTDFREGDIIKDAK